MADTAHFDHVASDYDNQFTHTEIGKAQRMLVHQFLISNLYQWNSIFEVNCGTGEDAIFLAQKGKSVMATDISDKMIETAIKKSKQYESLDVRFKTLDIKQLNDNPPDKKYDLIFSNFGGLNCLNKDELIQFLSDAKHKVMHDDSSIVMVMMSKGSIWETLFFLRKLNFKKAFRRYTNKALMVNIEGVEVPTYYYNPSFFKSLDKEFKIIEIRTIAFFLPPSYLEPLFKSKPKLLKTLLFLEKTLCKFGALSAFSDHYLIELKPR